MPTVKAEGWDELGEQVTALTNRQRDGCDRYFGSIVSSYFYSATLGGPALSDIPYRSGRACVASGREPSPCSKPLRREKTSSMVSKTRSLNTDRIPYFPHSLYFDL